MNKLFLQIEKRIKFTKDFDDDFEVATWIGLKKANYSRRKKSGSVPHEKILVACARDGISSDYIINGIGSPYAKQCLQSEEKELPSDNSSSVSCESTGKDDDFTTLIGQAGAVLQSGTIYAEALKQNIRAFFHGVTTETVPDKGYSPPLDSQAGATKTSAGNAG